MTTAGMTRRWEPAARQRLDRGTLVLLAGASWLMLLLIGLLLLQL